MVGEWNGRNGVCGKEEMGENLSKFAREGVGEVTCLNNYCQFVLWVGLVMNGEVIKIGRKGLCQ